MDAQHAYQRAARETAEIIKREKMLREFHCSTLDGKCKLTLDSHNADAEAIEFIISVTGDTSFDATDLDNFKMCVEGDILQYGGKEGQFGTVNADCYESEILYDFSDTSERLAYVPRRFIPLYVETAQKTFGGYHREEQEEREEADRVAVSREAELYEEDYRF